MGPEGEDALPWVQVAMQAVTTRRPYDLGNPTVLEVSVADSDGVWSPWQLAIGESECRPLGFWSEALPSFMDNYCSFERQLLACY